MLATDLIENGANINSLNRFNNTPLNDAVTYGNEFSNQSKCVFKNFFFYFLSFAGALDLVRLLIEYGANIDDKSIRDAAVHDRNSANILLNIFAKKNGWKQNNKRKCANFNFNFNFFQFSVWRNQ